MSKTATTFRRINGIGITISPVPGKMQHSISMQWFTFLFIPILPLGLYYITGIDDEKFVINCPITLKEYHKKYGTKKLISIICFGYFEGILTLVGLLLVIMLITWLRNTL